MACPGSRNGMGVRCPSTLLLVDSHIEPLASPALVQCMYHDLVVPMDRIATSHIQFLRN